MNASGCTLILGGARSGKSRFAQALAEALPGPLTYIATARALDDEMSDRIVRHQADRGPRWSTMEAPDYLPDRIAALPRNSVALIDCLTLWLSNRLLADADMEGEIATLAAAIEKCPASLIIVSNEVGSGIVPETPLGRLFRDHAGRANQAVAAVADRVALIVAGLPLWLKP